MNFKRISKNRLSLLLISIMLVSISLYLYSCGGGFSDPAVETTSTSVLITPQTLNGWITNGYGTDSRGFNKIVVLDVASETGTTSYTGSGHVPGAFLMNSGTDLNAPSRSDGVTDVINEVATKSQVEDVIHRTGIDQNTVIVITGDNMLNVGTAYFTFRYWGFPKERLKVLSGINKTFADAGFSLEKTVPAAPAPSTYSVCQLTQNTSMRASLSDMIQLAEGGVPNGFAWDVRTANEYNGVAGSTAGPTGASNGYTAFEGHIKGAINLIYTSLLSSDQSTFLDTETIRTSLNSIGVTQNKLTHVY